MNLRNAKVSVIGAERSGIAVAKLLQQKNAKIFVSDSNAKEKLQERIAELESLKIEYEAGKHSEKIFDCSLMVISPGVPTDSPIIIEAKKRKIKIVAEIEVASWYCSSPIIAVTGSNGKTTTTTLIDRILSDAKVKHVTGGNIGTAFSSFVDTLDKETVVVLEISSFQLDCIETFRPHIAVLLNITQNHMDRYEYSMEKYAQSKSRIFMNQSANDFLVYNADDMWTQSVVKNAQSQKKSFNTKEKKMQSAFVENGILKTKIDNTEHSIIPISEITIQGEHNLQNVMAATLATQLVGVTPAYIRATLKNFKGVEHRQEFVREVNGIKYINNSKATTVEAVAYSLKSYNEPIVLILGGKDKGNDYSEIFDLVKNKVRAIVATGYSADIIVKNFSAQVPVEKIETIGNEIPNIISMEKTISTATSLAKKGDVVLFSPACTSFDWFKDYEERGKIFKMLVNKL